MTPEQINIAIAEVCGWTGYCDRCSQGIVEHFDGEGNYIGSSGCDYCQGQHLPMPDYYHDLNAMHEAEEYLHGEQWAEYFDRIQRNGKATGVRATAPQRAEAFLRTIGKWDE